MFILLAFELPRLDEEKWLWKQFRTVGYEAGLRIDATHGRKQDDSIASVGVTRLDETTQSHYSYTHAKCTPTCTPTSHANSIQTQSILSC